MARHRKYKYRLRQVSDVSNHLIFPGQRWARRPYLHPEPSTSAIQSDFSGWRRQVVPSRVLGRNMPTFDDGICVDLLTQFTLGQVIRPITTYVPNKA